MKNNIVDSKKDTLTPLIGEKTNNKIEDKVSKDVYSIIDGSIEVVDEDELKLKTPLTKDLVIREKTNIPDEYLLAFVIKDLARSGYDFQNFWENMSSLSFDQLKDFDGNILDIRDKKHAILRALKLINLGLEYVVNNKETKEDRIRLAKAIFTQKPLELIYKVGKIFFEKDKEKILDTIKKSEIEVDGFWFRLFSKKDIDELKKFTDVDTIKGVYTEYENELRKIIKIQNKLTLIPFLSLKYCLSDLKHWGSIKKGDYPTEFGAIDNLLLSLIIACMFRSEKYFFASKTLVELGELEDFLIKDNQRKQTVLSKFIEEGVYNDYAEELKREIKIHANHFCHILEAKEQENKYRMSRKDDKRSQSLFLINILKVNIKEIEKFSDILFYKKDELRKKTYDIKNIFLEYFFEVGKTLNLKIPTNFDKIIENILIYTAQNVIEEVKNFYNTTTNSDISDIKIFKFWDQRVALENHKWSLNSDVRKSVITENLIKKGIIVEKIIRLPIEQIIDITKDFSSWNKKEKDEFCKKFNPNFVLLKEKKIEELIKLLENISHTFSSGSLENIQQSDVGNEESKKTLDIILSKINIASLDPYTIVEMWKLGSHQLRNFIFSKREDIKISIPSLKSHYIFEHEDDRLLSYVIERLIIEDKLKLTNKQMWEDLEQIACYCPNAKRVIEIKYRGI